MLTDLFTEEQTRWVCVMSPASRHSEDFVTFIHV